MPLPRRILLAALLLLGALVLPAPAGAAPRPQVLLIHGGSWFLVGPSMTARMADDARRLRAWGYETTNVDYRAEAQAFPDVLAAYDRLRARVGAATPICAFGSSAGAQMALLLALRRPDVACVISRSAPTRLDALRPRLRRHAQLAFDGLGGLVANSPATHRFRTPLLLEHGLGDPVVPTAQALLMHAAAPRSGLILLPRGDAPFTHMRVDAAALARAHERERRFLARWASAN